LAWKSVTTCSFHLITARGWCPETQCLLPPDQETNKLLFRRPTPDGNERHMTVLVASVEAMGV
jgi:hypothetical protein